MQFLNWSHLLIVGLFISVCGNMEFVVSVLNADDATCWASCCKFYNMLWCSSASSQD